MGEKSINSTRVLLTTPNKSHQVLLTTFRRNGQGVNTQVGTVAANGKIYFMTAADTWKARRIANNPHVALTPCTGRGKALGPAIEGTARRLAGPEVQRARALLRIGVLGHFWSFIFDRRNPGDKTAVYEVELGAGMEEHPAQKASFA
jgi:PPOX class probable F420-dependent enzyme